MNSETIPLTNAIPTEVPLPNAPLERVIAQVRFPPILSVNKAEAVADFQEMLRAIYPHLQRDNIRNIEIEPNREPIVSDAVVWRFADRSDSATWRVSLGLDFVALETWSYHSRTDFLNRLATVLASVETCFTPAETQRLGLRYVDRIEGEAISKVSELVHSRVLGILQPHEGLLDVLRQATVRSMTHAQFEAEEGAIQGRWGALPANTTFDVDALQPIPHASWVLDLDMFSRQILPFNSNELVSTAATFAKRIYSVFRLMVTDEFLRYYGGTP